MSTSYSRGYTLMGLSRSSTGDSPLLKLSAESAGESAHSHLREFIGTFRYSQDKGLVSSAVPSLSHFSHDEIQMAEDDITRRRRLPA